MQISILREWLEHFLSRTNLINPLEKDVIYFDSMIDVFIKNKDKITLTLVISEFQHKRLCMALEFKDKIAKFLSKSSNETLDAVFTYFCNTDDKEYVILLLKNIKENNNPKYYEYVDRFIYTADFTNITAINNFLQVTGIHYSYIINQLMMGNYTFSLETYIVYLVSYLSSFDVSNICQQIANIKYCYCNIQDKKHYYFLISKIFEKSHIFDYYNFNYLLRDYQYRSNFSYFLSHNYHAKIDLLVIYGKYLHCFFGYEYSYFEDLILSKMDVYSLIDYSSKAYFCSKRKFLEKVLSFKDQNMLIDFIKRNPEFQKLLPLM